MTKYKLEQAIESLNKRCYTDRNTDDQLVRVIAVDKKTKGWSFIARYDDYALISDFDKLRNYIEVLGLNSDAVQRFNNTLISKGGEAYKNELYSQLKELWQDQDMNNYLEN